MATGENAAPSLVTYIADRHLADMIRLAEPTSSDEIDARFFIPGFGMARFFNAGLGNDMLSWGGEFPCKERLKIRANLSARPKESLFSPLSAILGEVGPDNNMAERWKRDDQCRKATFGLPVARPAEELERVVSEGFDNMVQRLQSAKPLPPF
ncbi:hypothetical protein NKJ10_29910 [Mesorhizobium sp. M0204]|uniref:hypothetical protein n=1 Tax=Mesorhizobium sp. M0204 TaxID=2956913 RepID=UPI0033375CFA